MKYVKSCLIITMLLGIGYSQCDANGDGDLNIQDVVIEVNCILTPGCWDGEPVCEGVEDTDGNCYETIQIGDQLWMAENLKVTHYNNGDEIAHPSNEDFGSFDEGQYSVYDNDPSNADIYGNLYNFAAVDDDRGVCPDGFHVPSDGEWTILTDFIAPEGIESWGNSIAGGKMKESGTEHWYSPNTGATNESGFTCLPAGYRNDSNGGYGALGSYGYFWSSSESNSSSAWARELSYNYSDVIRGSTSKQSGFSIRCSGD